MVAIAIAIAIKLVTLHTTFHLNSNVHGAIHKIFDTLKLKGLVPNLKSKMGPFEVA